MYFNRHQLVPLSYTSMLERKMNTAGITVKPQVPFSLLHFRFLIDLIRMNVAR